MTMDQLGFIEKQICSKNTIPTSPLISMHKNSQTISKVKPKIRIIHIFAPEIIKTDAANFRELVQRLTGKPTDDDDDNREEGCAKKKSRSSKKRDQRVFISSNKIKGEEEIWRGANSGGGFLGGFAHEFDGFMQELNQFPFLEGTTQMDAYGEPQLA